MNQRFSSFFFERSYQNILKPILFRFDPESTHDFFTEFGSFLGKYRVTRVLTRFSFAFEDPRLEQKLFGIRFKNPIGLSAGFDSDANLVGVIPEVGFGFEEVGSITDQPYMGNPKPRLWRLPKSRGLIVNIGAKNIGVTRIIQKLKNYHHEDFPLAISIGRTNSKKTVSITTGIADYYRCLRALVEAEIGDIYVINISCPNTFGGEPFTTSDKLQKLLSRLLSVKTKKPILVKMPINLSWKEFAQLLAVIVKYKIPGVIIGNLNENHLDSDILDNLPEEATGGISGKPTFKLSNQLIKQTYKKYQNKLLIIGTGGIFSASDAYEKIRLGASLVSLATGLVFQGPQLAGQINADLVKLLEKDGYRSVSQAIGAAHRRK